MRGEFASPQKEQEDDDVPTIVRTVSQQVVPPPSPPPELQAAQQGVLRACRPVNAPLSPHILPAILPQFPSTSACLGVGGAETRAFASPLRAKRVRRRRV